jgi:hypothetical protein
MIVQILTKFERLNMNRLPLLRVSMAIDPLRDALFGKAVGGVYRDSPKIRKERIKRLEYLLRLSLSLSLFTL